MKDKKQGHRHGRSSRGFESHTVRSSNHAHGGYKRNGEAWRFFDFARSSGNPFEPHFRVTARMAALPGKHMRSVREPDRAAHGKDA